MLHAMDSDTEPLVPSSSAIDAAEVVEAPPQPEAQNASQHQKPPPPQPPKPLKLIACISLWLLFSISMQYAFGFNSAYPYLRHLAHSTTALFYGCTVSIFSFVQMLLSPLVGRLHDRLGVSSTLPILLTGIVMMISMDVLYASAALLPTEIRLCGLVIPREYAVLAARALGGVGASTCVVLRACIVFACDSTNLHVAMSYLGFAYSAGMIVAPLTQLLFVPLGGEGERQLASLSMYNAPALLFIVVNVASGVVIWRMFGKAGSRATGPARYKPSMCAIATCLMTGFARMFVLTTMETIGALLVTTLFALDSRQTLVWLSVANGLMALFAFLSYAAHRFRKMQNLRVGAISALSSLIAFYVITFPAMPFLHNAVTIYDGHAKDPLSVGCDSSRYTWCHNVHPFNPIYMLATYAVFLGVGLSTLAVSLNSLYPGLVGGHHNMGVYQGWLTTSESVSRAVVPFLMSWVFTSFGPHYVWALEIVVLVLTLSMWVAFYSKMKVANTRMNNLDGDAANGNDGVIVYNGRENPPARPFL